MTSESEAWAATEIVALYDRTAEAWDSARGDALREGAWLGRLTDGLPEGASALDVGCGTGRPIAAALLARGFSVTGVDSSPRLLARAAAALPGGEWVRADMRALEFGRRFDAVLAWHSLFHLDHADQRRTLPLLAAHVAPGGRLMFTSGTSHGVAMGEWQGEPLFHASLAPEEYRAILTEAGLTVESYSPGDDATVWLARRQIKPASGLDGSA